MLSYYLKIITGCKAKNALFIKNAVLVYNIINDNSSPSYRRELITVYTPIQRDIFVPHKKSLLYARRKQFKTFGKISFSHAAPEVWNKLKRIHKVFPMYCYLSGKKTAYLSTYFSNHLLHLHVLDCLLSIILSIHPSTCLFIFLFIF